MSQQMIDTPHGLAKLVTYSAQAPKASVMLTHGAGGGIDAADLTALAHTLPVQGFEVHLLEMPWRVAGKKIAPRPQVLDECFTAVLASAGCEGPVVIGGRSAGARVSCRLAQPLGVAGVLALAFPLHPPGRPESSRLGELEMVACPLLVVQGERDTFGGPDEFPANVNLLPVPFADHSLKVPKRVPTTQSETLQTVTDGVAAWLSNHFG